jgi:hypothetical protein
MSTFESGITVPHEDSVLTQDALVALARDILTEGDEAAMHDGRELAAELLRYWGIESWDKVLINGRWFGGRQKRDKGERAELVSVGTPPQPSEHHHIIHTWILANVSADVVPGGEVDTEALLYNMLALLYDGPAFEPYHYLPIQHDRLRQWGVSVDEEED